MVYTLKTMPFPSVMSGKCRNAGVFFFPPGCDSTRDDLSRDFGDVVIPPCCIPFCILAQGKVVAFLFFVECKGQEERSWDNIRWLWFLLELRFLMSCFVVYKFVGLKNLMKWKLSFNGTTTTMLVLDLFQHRFESLPFFSQKQNLEVIFFHNRSTRWWIY